NETPLIFEKPEIYYRFGNSPNAANEITPVKNGEVPYSRSNGWYIKVYDGFINPNKDLFHEMRDKSHMGGDGKIYEGTLDGGLCYSGSMGGTGKPHVEIILQYCSSKNSAVIKHMHKVNTIRVSLM
ncbi:46213_t:CDS:2, partial [Gigaspora margarita]